MQILTSVCVRRVMSTTTLNCLNSFRVRVMCPGAVVHNVMNAIYIFPNVKCNNVKLTLIMTGIFFV